MATLYEEIVEAGIEHSHHYSDLYVRATHTARAIIEKHGAKYNTFINQVEGGLWYDVPFAYDPYWDRLFGNENKTVLGNEHGLSTLGAVGMVAALWAMVMLGAFVYYL